MPPTRETPLVMWIMRQMSCDPGAKNAQFSSHVKCNNIRRMACYLEKIYCTEDSMMLRLTVHQAEDLDVDARSGDGEVTESKAYGVRGRMLLSQDRYH